MVVIRITESNESLIGTLALLSSSLPTVSTKSPRKALVTGAKPGENPSAAEKKLSSRVPISLRTTQTKDLTSTAKEQKPKPATPTSHTQAAGARPSSIPRWVPASSKKGAQSSDSRKGTLKGAQSSDSRKGTPKGAQSSKLPRRSDPKKTASEKTKADAMKTSTVDVVSSTAESMPSPVSAGNAMKTAAPSTFDVVTERDDSTADSMPSPVSAGRTDIAKAAFVTDSIPPSRDNSATTTDSLVLFQELEAECNAEENNQLPLSSQRVLEALKSDSATARPMAFEVPSDQHLVSQWAAEQHLLRLGSQQVLEALQSDIATASPLAFQARSDQHLIGHRAAEQHCELKYVATQTPGLLNDIEESVWESETPHLAPSRISVPRVSEVEVIRQIPDVSKASPITRDQELINVDRDLDSGELMDTMATTMGNLDPDGNLTQPPHSNTETSIYDQFRQSSSSSGSHYETTYPVPSDSHVGSPSDSHVSSPSDSHTESPLSESELWRRLHAAGCGSSQIAPPPCQDQPEASPSWARVVAGDTAHNSVVDEEVDIYTAYSGAGAMGSHHVVDVDSTPEFDEQLIRAEGQSFDDCPPVNSYLASRMGFDLTQISDDDCSPVNSSLASRTLTQISDASRDAEAEQLRSVDKSERRVVETRDSFVLPRQSLSTGNSVRSEGTFSGDDGQGLEHLMMPTASFGADPYDCKTERDVGLTQGHGYPSVVVRNRPADAGFRPRELTRQLSHSSFSSCESILSETSGRGVSRLDLMTQDEERTRRNRPDDTQNLQTRTGGTRSVRRQYSRLPLTTATDRAAERFESFQECRNLIDAARKDATLNGLLAAHNLEWVPTPKGLVTMPKGCVETEERQRKTREHFTNPVAEPKTPGVSLASAASWFGPKLNERGKGPRVRPARTIRQLGLTWEEILGPDRKCVGWKQPTTFACRVPQHSDYLNDLDANLSSRCFAEKLPAPREYNDTPFADLSREVLRTMASNLLVNQLKLCPGSVVLRMPPTPSFKEVRKPWMKALKEIVAKHLNSFEKQVARLILNAYKYRDHDGNSDHEEFRGFLVLLTVLDRVVVYPEMFEHVTKAVFRANELNLLKEGSNLTMMITVHDPCRATLSNCVFAAPDEKDAYLQGVMEGDPLLLDYYLGPDVHGNLTPDEHRSLVTLMVYTGAFGKAAPEIAVLHGLEAWADVIKNFSTNRLAAVGRNTSEPGIPFLDMGFRGPLAAALEHLQDGLAFSVMAMTKNVKNPGQLIENTLCALPMMDHIIHYLQMIGVFDNRQSTSLRRPLVDLVDCMDVIATKSHSVLCGLKSRPWMTKEDVAYTLTSLDCICQGLFHALEQKHREVVSNFESMSKRRVTHKQTENLIRLHAQAEALAISESRLVEIRNHLVAIRDIKGVQEYLRMFGTSVHHTDLRYMTAPNQCQTLQDQYVDKMHSRMTVSVERTARPGSSRIRVLYPGRENPYRVERARNAGRNTCGTTTSTFMV